MRNLRHGKEQVGLVFALEVFLARDIFCLSHPALCCDWCSKCLAGEVQGQRDVQALQEERVKVMNGTNPQYVLRNYIAQNAIEAAENGDFSEIRFRSMFSSLFCNRDQTFNTASLLTFICVIPSNDVTITEAFSQ